MDEKRKQEFFEELEKLSSEGCYVGQKHYDEPKRSEEPDDDDWCGTGDGFFTDKLIMGFYAIKNRVTNLFGKKKVAAEEAEIFSSPLENETAKKLYNDTAPEIRDKVFYGDAESAQAILVMLANECFHSTSEQTIKLCYQIYTQCWLRSRGGFGRQFSEPGYILSVLTQEFPNVPRRKVKSCAKRALKYISSREYFSEHEFATEAPANDWMNWTVSAIAEGNVEIQDLYLHDEEYGKKPDKPIFVNGFGNDKEYLSHLYTQDGVKLTFERVGSSEVDGICGPVDLYKLLLPDGGLYMNIFLCNYGTRNTTDVPKGVVYQ